MRCQVCGEGSESIICPECGYDNSVLIKKRKRVEAKSKGKSKQATVDPVKEVKKHPVK
jgi:hypothetical protein